MQYILLLLEGLITFISPCLLPMLPIYISYFSAGQEDGKTGSVVKNACGFVVGFTTVFIFLGIFAGFLGGLLIKYQSLLNIMTGCIVLLFGLHYIGIVNIPILSKGIMNIPILGKISRNQIEIKTLGFGSAILFGIIFSIGWTPCVGTFLGSALMMASHQGSMLQGCLLLLFYSIGLGIPFILSAILLDRFKKSFDIIKQNYKTINIISGVLLIIMGVLMITGLMSRWLVALSF